MAMFDDILRMTEEREAITHFVAYDKGYYAILDGGGRLDIVRVFNLQPPIENDDDYHAFMFVETFQGFYLLRQRVIAGKPKCWETWLRIEPEKPACFFNNVYSAWMEICSCRDLK